LIPTTRSGLKRRPFFRNFGVPVGAYLLLVFESAASSGEVEWSPRPLGDRTGWNQGSAIAWLVTCGTPQEDWINRLVELPDGNILATGFIGRDDAASKPDWSGTALKFSESGRMLWSRAFGGSGIDAVWAIQELPDHRLALGGFSSKQSAGDWDAWLVLLRENGALESEHRFGGAKNDRATDLVLTRDEKLLLIGETTSTGAGERDVFVVKTDLRGKEIWRKTFGGPEMDRGFAGVRTAEGGAAIIGTTGSEEKHSGLVLQLDGNGKQLWRTLIEGNKSVTPHFVSLLPNGKMAVIGYTDSWGASVHDYFAAIVSPEGAIETLQILGGAEDDRAMTSAPSADGGCWIVGYSKSFGAGDWDVLIAHLKSDGSFDPQVIRAGSSSADQGTAIAEAKNGDLLIGGYTSAPSGGSAPPDLFLMRMNPQKAERTTRGVVVEKVR
jgi:hypothetical protein